VPPPCKIALRGTNGIATFVRGPVTVYFAPEGVLLLKNVISRAVCAWAIVASAATDSATRAGILIAILRV
jgi:hypothetical protein